jgi:carbamoyltransferase
MYILGISGGIRPGNWDAAAVLLKDGELLAAVEEERLTHVKHAPGMLPEQAIRFCLKNSGIRIQDVDCVVFPGETYVNMAARIEEFLQFRFGYAPPVKLVNHHLAHAASAYRMSGFQDAMIITLDFSGDQTSGFLAHGSGCEIRPIKTFPFPNSLGLFYAIITQFLGFNMGDDEYKVMGLASYGKDPVDLSWFLRITDDAYELNTEFLRIPAIQGEPSLSTQEAFFNEHLCKRLGRPKLREEPWTSFHQNLALGAQHALEEAVIRLVEFLHKQSGSRNICIAGGIGLNCSMNQKLAALPFVERIFIPPVPGDSGISLGAALETAAAAGHSFAKLEHAYWGPAFSNDQIEHYLKESGAKYVRSQNVGDIAAEKIADDKIIGWFQGALEYGARALGNRSILADARNPHMKDRINRVVKFREPFRPFAPSVMAEHAGEFYENISTAPFMSMTFNVKKDKIPLIPSVTHVDGTARVQTVEAETNPKFHDVLEAFYERTKIPLVVNTSFNIKGQPIVDSPYEALCTFFGTGLDALIMGDFVLEKE